MYCICVSIGGKGFIIVWLIVEWDKGQFVRGIFFLIIWQ